ncbi:MAG: hypothetical protein AAFX94_06475, partial [Myxococcota bacterium]
PRWMAGARETVHFHAVHQDQVEALPADATEWAFEAADDTQKGAGQLDYVISGKRRAFFEYAVGELEDEKADGVALAALESQVAALGLLVQEATGGGAGGENDYGSGAPAHRSAQVSRARNII